MGVLLLLLILEMRAAQRLKLKWLTVVQISWGNAAIICVTALKDRRVYRESVRVLRQGSLLCTAARNQVVFLVPSAHIQTIVRTHARESLSVLLRQIVGSPLAKTMEMIVKSKSPIASVESVRIYPSLLKMLCVMRIKVCVHHVLPLARFIVIVLKVSFATKANAKLAQLLYIVAPSSVVLPRLAAMKKREGLAHAKVTRNARKIQTVDPHVALRKGHNAQSCKPLVSRTVLAKARLELLLDDVLPMEHACQLKSVIPIVTVLKVSYVCRGNVFPCPLA